MRFRSSRDEASYVVIPVVPTVVNGRMVNLPGLKAEFRGGIFDSDAAARWHRWSPEQKDLVERHLLEHFEFERRGGFYLEDGETIPPWYQRPDQQGEVRTSPAPMLSETCIFMIRTPEGSETCGKASSVGPFCAEHAKLAGWDEEKPKPGKAKEKEPAIAGSD